MEALVHDSWEDMLDEPDLPTGLGNINFEEPNRPKVQDDMDGETADDESVDGEMNLPEHKISRIKQVMITESHLAELGYELLLK